MIRHSGTVVAVEGDHAWIECRRGGACAVCPGRHACEIALFSSPSRHRLRARTGGQACILGAEVVIGIPPGALVRAAVLAYGLPLAGLLTGTALGALAGTALSPAGALLGLVAGIAAATRAGRRRMPDSPRILDTLQS
jgi:sigma-E factor negative regulatory protein RseC